MTEECKDPSESAQDDTLSSPKEATTKPYKSLSENAENENCKIIVLQLSFQSSENTVEEYFTQFGDIENLDLKRYPDGASRGFAFIVFKSEESVPKTLEVLEHIIDGRRVTVEKARTRSEKMQTNKIFIGKLPSELTDANLREYFGDFGEVAEIQFVYDKQTNERRGYCFIEFNSNTAVERITKGKIPPESAKHRINEFEIDVKKKFDDNHPIQRKIKAIERQKKNMDYYSSYGMDYSGHRNMYYGMYGYNNHSNSNNNNISKYYNPQRYIADNYGYYGYCYEDYFMYNQYYYDNNNQNPNCRN